ncbi:Agmatine deiminase [Thalassoglobus neptunius]|uniref:Agmatine deiminase n=2 Tax=Thalassoglobus neptunius TaxID=1938619 RepID=A0A5C5X9D4_9PLAN|nr:Agmatine deiminase [Thalassoglobus neptunius]
MLILVGAVGGVYWVENSQPLAASKSVGERASLFKPDLFEQFEQSVDYVTLAPRARDNLNFEQSMQLNLAHKYFTDFLKTWESDPALLFEVARAHQQIGKICFGSRDYILSLEAYDAAIATVENASLNDFSSRYFTAVTRTLQATTYAMTGRDAEALESTRLAVQELRSLLKESPDDYTYSSSLAVALRNQAILLESIGQPSLDAAAESVAIAEYSAEIASTPFQAIDIIFNAMGVRAELAVRNNDTVQATETAQRAITRLNDFIAIIPEVNRKGDNLYPLQQYERTLLNFKELLHTLNNSPESEDPTIAAGLNNQLHSWRAYLIAPRPAITLSTTRFQSGQLFPDHDNQDLLLLAWHDWCAKELLEVISAAKNHIRIAVLVSDMETRRFLAGRLKDGIKGRRIQLVNVETDSPWIQDYGPQSFQSIYGEPTWCDPSYSNALTRPHYRDDESPKTLSSFYDLRPIETPVLLEGGAVVGNGTGILLVSQHILERNAELGITRDMVSRTLQRVYGGTQIQFIETLHRDPTSHIDWFATFPTSDTVLLGSYGSDDPENRILLDRHSALLRTLQTPSGSLKVKRIPMPPHEGDFFGGSYTNVVYLNGLVLVPSWENAPRSMEASVRAIYREALPGWEVRMIDSTALGRRGGALRCMTKTVRVPERVIQTLFEES